MSKAKLNITTPMGELQWVFITGEGKVNDDGSAKYSASINMPADVAEPIIDQLHTFWEENKPTKTASPYSMGYKTQEDGSVSFTFKTGTEFNGKHVKIGIFDSKGKQVQNFDKLIGNGSIGRIQGSAAIYETKVNKGVTLYLSGIQLKKLIEYSAGAAFDSIDDGDDDNFDTEEFSADEVVVQPDHPKAKPRF